jgi:eRF1 domain 3
MPWYAGGENGFSQAIELASDTLSNVKFVQEKRLISKFFDEISQDTGKYGFGVSDTMQLMEMGAVETLIVSENLDHDRVTLKNQSTGEVVKVLSKEQQKKPESFKCGVRTVLITFVATDRVTQWRDLSAECVRGRCKRRTAPLHSCTGWLASLEAKVCWLLAGTRMERTWRLQTACLCSSG